MRNIPKNGPPQLLLDNKASWEAALAAKPSSDRCKYRYRELKEDLLQETQSKCVYCESKIGHNCPGDIEHKIPVVEKPELRFEWDNLTIACTECNRRKGTYYEPTCMFLDPNQDDVESMITHYGVLVFPAPNSPRSEVTIGTLELNDIKSRRTLLARKIEALEALRHLIERILDAPEPVLKKFLTKQLREEGSVDKEFSGMAKTFIENVVVNTLTCGFNPRRSNSEAIDVFDEKT